MKDSKTSNDMKQDPGTHGIAVALNHVLSNEYSLFTQTLNYHRNITGPRFHSSHLFLDGQYHELLEIMDSVAERVRVLDEHPFGTIKQLYSDTELKDSTQKQLMAEDMLKNLYKDHQQIKSQIKEIVCDDKMFANEPGVQDFLTGVLEKHETMAWMLKSHLV